MAVVPRKQSSSVSIVIVSTDMGSVVKNRSEAELNLVMQTCTAFHVLRTASTKVWSASGGHDILQSELIMN
jgi:hypothetical protein